jgi:Family of unknown function (DUF6011)
MFKTAQDVREFVTAGNARITIRSKKTGQHFTYQIRQCHDQKGNPVLRWFVSGLSGPNNEDDYTYLGLLDQRSGDIEFRLTEKSRFSDDALSVRGFRYMWNHVYADRMPNDMDIYHEGRCGRCNRTLTVPESLDRGIGPECAEIMGIAA